MSTARINHVAEALRLDDVADGHLVTDEFAYADMALKSAQVHATLALVEQQRIANLITIAGWIVDAGKDDVRHDLNAVAVGQADAVWEALGLS